MVHSLLPSGRIPTTGIVCTHGFRKILHLKITSWGSFWCPVVKRLTARAGGYRFDLGSRNVPTKRGVIQACANSHHWILCPEPMFCHKGAVLRDVHTPQLEVVLHSPRLEKSLEQRCRPGTASEGQASALINEK